LTVSIAAAVDGKQRAAEDAIVESSTLPYVAFASKLPQPMSLMKAMCSAG
jgi:hypothetical protein